MTVGIIILSKINKLKDLKKIYTIFTIIGLIGLLPVQYHWHKYQSNIDNMGNMLEPDYVIIADYLKRDYDKVYVVSAETPNFRANVQDVYGYLMCNYEVVDLKEEVDRDMTGQKVALIFIKDFDIVIEGVEPKDLNTQYVKLYTNDGNNSERLKIRLDK